MTEMQSGVSFALFEPDIPQNAGNIFRTAACLNVPVHVIEPCGFALSHAKLRRAGMDYIDHLDMNTHSSWAQFVNAKPYTRLVLLTTKGDESLPKFDFISGDCLLLGRESAGVPDDVHEFADIRLGLPMRKGLRSMNVSVAGAIAGFEALRQLQALPSSNTIG
ncbi:tRNA (cytidine(34)-2'-O)-methyltransferase [Rhodospirillales bacterium]|nr:tRNA (cytidine(34)-2'-O)-methyltransferase [Rhodospirillales bacterium]